MIVLVRKDVPADSLLIVAAEGMEPKIRDAFLRAVKAVKDDTTVAAIAAALESGSVDEAMKLLDVEGKLEAALGGKGLAAGVQSVREAIQQTFASGAQAAIKQLPSRIGVDVAFDMFNPRTVGFLNGYSMDLIKGITDQTRDSIRQVIVDAFQNGGHPREQAREIREMIGLTPYQQRAVDNYRAALEGGSQADLQNALGRALRDGRYDRSLLSAMQNQTSLPPAKVDVMVGRYEERFINYRATTIARTESLRAANKGQRALWEQAVEQGLLPGDVEREWEVSGDERTCDECNDLDGETARLDEEFAPGIMEPPDPHPDCFPDGTLCMAKNLSGATHRLYDGSLVICKTAAGNRLACTPNHPILAGSGWIPARFLYVGGDVVSSRDQIWRESPRSCVGLKENHENVPSRIEDIVNALRSSCEMRSSKMPVAAEDFHGDGIGSDVAVIYSKRFLWNAMYAAFFKELDKRFFQRAATCGTGVSFERFGSFLRAACGSFYSSYSSVGGGGQGFSFAFAGLSHAQVHRFASASLCDSSFTQSCYDAAARDGKVLCQFFDGVPFSIFLKHIFNRNFASSRVRRATAFSQSDSGGKKLSSNSRAREVLNKPFDRPSGSVFLDKIVKLDVVRFIGQVYNLQTATHEYVANGIITHNCRCTTKISAASLRKAV